MYSWVVIGNMDNAVSKRWNGECNKLADILVSHVRHKNMIKRIKFYPKVARDQELNCKLLLSSVTILNDSPATYTHFDKF